MKNGTFFQGDARTVKAKKNIAASMVLKGVDALVYLLLVPVTLGYLNSYEYGVWLTLNSILMWIDSFDIGLGNGLRNRLAIAIAQGNKKLGRYYVSTTFWMLIIIMTAMVILGTVVGPFVNWYDLLGTVPDKVPHLNQIVYVTFIIFCFNFIFKFIGNVYLAMQMPAINNLMIVSGHLLSLVIIFILTKTTPGSFLGVALVYSISPLVVYLTSYPITFLKIYPYLKPSIHCFDRQYLRSLFRIGIQFFLIQLSSILLFAFSNLLISHMFGPENVTPYNIAYRYFSLVPVGMGVILAPLWSATTDAYTKGDIVWIEHTMRNVRRILLLVAVILVLMTLCSNFVYRIWIGPEVNIPFSLSCLMALYVGIIVHSLSYSHFLNGLGKLKIQTINTVLVAVLFIPVCYWLGTRWGVMGVVAGMCLLNTSGLILNRIQFHKIIHETANGIWGR